MFHGWLSSRTIPTPYSQTNAKLSQLIRQRDALNIRIDNLRRKLDVIIAKPKPFIPFSPGPGGTIYKFNKHIIADLRRGDVRQRTSSRFIQ